MLLYGMYRYVSFQTPLLQSPTDVVLVTRKRNTMLLVWKRETDFIKDAGRVYADIRGSASS